MCWDEHARWWNGNVTALDSFLPSKGNQCFYPLRIWSVPFSFFLFLFWKCNIWWRENIYQDNQCHAWFFFVRLYIVIVYFFYKRIFLLFIFFFHLSSISFCSIKLNMDEINNYKMFCIRKKNFLIIKVIYITEVSDL